MIKEVKFQDFGQDLLSMTVLVKGSIGEIVDVKLPNLKSIYVGMIVNTESLEVGKNLEILNFKERCSDFIKYPITEINSKKVLRLTLKKKWFEMFLSGDKKEEYREIKEHWITRLTLYPFQGSYKMKEFDYVEFTNGYGRKKPIVVYECNGIDIGIGNPDLGSPDYPVFKILTGSELYRENVK